MASVIENAPLITGIIVVLISIIGTGLARALLDLYKRKLEKRDKLIEAYRDTIEIFSRKNEKNSSDAEEIENILSENYHRFDREFQDLVPSSVEFSGFWCVSGFIFSGQKGEPPIPSIQVEFFSLHDKIRVGTLKQGQVGFVSPTIHFWFRDDEDKSRWAKVADSALIHYNKLAKSKRTANWMFLTFPTNADLPKPKSLSELLT